MEWSKWRHVTNNGERVGKKKTERTGHTERREEFGEGDRDRER